MAFTATKSESTVFGNERVWQGTVSSDVASGVVTPGFSVVRHVQWSPISMATVGIRVRANATAAGVAANGTVGVSGLASGDELYLTIFGR